MSRKHRRTVALKKKRDLARKKKFYDSNTLDLYLCQKEIANMNNTGFVAITSYLAVGEAVCSIINKEKDPKQKETKANKFMEFLIEQNNRGSLRLTSSEKVKENVKRLFGITDLDIADVHNLATAIYEECVSLVSADSDFCGMGKPKINEIKNEFKLREFTIEKRTLPK